MLLSGGGFFSSLECREASLSCSGEEGAEISSGYGQSDGGDAILKPESHYEYSKSQLTVVFQRNRWNNNEGHKS